MSSIASTIPTFIAPARPAQPPLPQWVAASGAGALVDALGDIVLRSPSVLHRVIRIAELRNASGNTYESPLGPGFDPASVSEALRKLHVEMFANWLTLSLKAQKADLTLYLNLVDRRERLGRLRQLIDRAECAIPVGAIQAERELFMQDLKIVCVLLEDEL
jgi:hypothetical protein